MLSAPASAVNSRMTPVAAGIVIVFFQAAERLARRTVRQDVNPT